MKHYKQMNQGAIIFKVAFKPVRLIEIAHFSICSILKRHKITTFIIHFYEKLTSHFQNVKVYYPQEEIVLLSFV